MKLLLVSSQIAKSPNADRRSPGQTPIARPNADHRAKRRSPITTPIAGPDADRRSPGQTPIAGHRARRRSPGQTPNSGLNAGPSGERRIMSPYGLHRVDLHVLSMLGLVVQVSSPDPVSWLTGVVYAGTSSPAGRRAAERGATRALSSRH